MRSHLSEASTPDELVVELTQLTGYRADLMADWVRGINRLRGLLGSVFPALKAAFDYSTRTPLILVAGLCTPAEIRTAGVEGVTAHLLEHRAWPAGVAKTTATAVAVANEQQLALPGEAATAAWSSGGWPASCLTCTARSKTSTRPSPSVSVITLTRGLSSRCPASDPTSARNPWWLPAGT
jgi:hypothetical protein